MFETIQLIGEHFAQLPRVCAAAVLGSQAAAADQQPCGWDIWIICRQPRPRDETVDSLWSGHLCPVLLRGMYIRRGRFQINGVAVRCDVWELEKVQRCLDQVLIDADPEPDFAPWFAGADCPEVMCHDILTCRPLFDHDGCFDRWKAGLTAYPQSFRAILLGQVLLEARYRLKDMRRGLELSDLPLFHMGLSQLGLCLLRMAFAINERYFPGLKRALRGAAGMSSLPADFARRIEQLISAPLDARHLDVSLSLARQLTVDMALQALAVGGDVRRAVIERGLTDWPDPDPLSLASQSPTPPARG
jgi:hypothetical protein